MTEQKFYERQPNVLPAVLPAGTRTIDGFGGTLKFPAHLKEGIYHGDWYTWNNRTFHLVHPDNVLWSTVPVQMPAPPEPVGRPIQPGDWVECVDAIGAESELILSERYEVTSAQTLCGQPAVSLIGKRVHWVAHRFKRVDGPHVEATTPLEKTVHAQLYGVDPGHSERGVVSRVTMAGGKVVAVEPVLSATVGTGNAQPSGSGETTKCDPYHAHNAALYPDLAYKLPCPESMAARARLAAWERAEKPRVTNRAEARELARVHPWEEFE